MPRLADPQRVLDAIGLSVGGDAALARARTGLDNSLPLIESILETKIGRRSTLDAFNAQYGASAPIDFRLTHRFIDVDTVAVYNRPLTAARTLTSEWQLASSSYSVDPDRGVLTLLDTPAYTGDGALLITYESGFSASPDDEDVYDAPDTLVAIAVQAAVLEMNVSPSAQAQRSQTKQQSVLPAIHAYLRGSCSGMVRPRNSVIFPSYTTAYD